MELTKTEEDYLKALFHIIVEKEADKAGTNQLAEYLGLSPASVNNMLKKLRSKALVAYEKYGKLELTDKGKSIAMRLIRKHRLWETFLYQHMNFSWDEVHGVAEQLEHIQSPKLIAELDKFLGFPGRDPHGAIIPSAEGEYNTPPKVTLSSLQAGDTCRLVSVDDSSEAFLRYVSRIGLALNSEIQIREVQEFDSSMMIVVEGASTMVSKQFADEVFVEKI
ncbi:MAG: metal-dependent transcriptional regulator [Phaeodactylibacter sp.]|nr:metal-dependent transcriptional regulator [Phaeodactylibacter sp.]MCB9300157.1 metal-dependent transcriptional regulator [Lewinellaceae bacterium]HQU60308.1 metal-dependent transcriptional regulator [Saprospiraceae bacterium]